MPRIAKVASSLALAVFSTFASTQPMAKSPVGESHPSYTFAATGETMAYRVYVPADYDPARPMPLVVMLHGAGGDENRILQGRDGPMIEKLADQHHFLVLAPRGYKGGYGNIYPVVVTRETAGRAQAEAGSSSRAAPGRPGPGGEMQPPAPTAAVPADDYAEQPGSQLQASPANELSEQETLAAIAAMRKAYAVDPARIYLVGNSMGGVGTAYLAAKYPEMWAAVAPCGGPLAAWSYPFAQLRKHHLPALYVHGEFDEHANPHWSQVVYDAARAEGVDAHLLIVKGGSHGGAWLQALPQIFDFFDAHRRSAPNS